MISADILSREAKRLKDDMYLQEAIDRIRKNALQKLCTAKPDDITEIIAQQVRVKFCSELFSELETMINSGQAKRKVTAI
jgi:hypothetical protein